MCCSAQSCSTNSGTLAPVATKTEVWLFPGKRSHASDHPITPKVIYHACKRAARRPAFGWCASAHAATLLCHASAEAGADLRTIQMLLGHSDLEETPSICISRNVTNATASPLDSLS